MFQVQHHKLNLLWSFSQNLCGLISDVEILIFFSPKMHLLQAQQAARPRVYIFERKSTLFEGNIEKFYLNTSPIFQDMGKRTPSTSAIYETLRRSKELRESLSRPGSRMSMDNIPDKLKEPVSEKYYLLDKFVAKFNCR